MRRIDILGTCVCEIGVQLGHRVISFGLKKTTLHYLRSYFRNPQDLGRPVSLPAYSLKFTDEESKLTKKFLQA